MDVDQPSALKKWMHYLSGDDIEEYTDRLGKQHYMVCVQSLWLLAERLHIRHTLRRLVTQYFHKTQQELQIKTWVADLMAYGREYLMSAYLRNLFHEMSVTPVIGFWHPYKLRSNEIGCFYDCNDSKFKAGNKNPWKW